MTTISGVFLSAMRPYRLRLPRIARSLAMWRLAAALPLTSRAGFFARVVRVVRRRAGARFVARFFRVTFLRLRRVVVARLGRTRA